MKRTFIAIAVLVLTTRAARGATCSPTTFITAATYPAPAPSAVLVADFNHDGIPDVATYQYNGGTVAVLLNAGDGTLGAPIVTNVGYTVYQAAAADLRGNGTTDLVVTVYSGVAVLLGNGDGTFGTPVVYPTSQYYPTAIVVGRFDGNDTLDVAVVDASGQNIDVLPGNGNGTLGAPRASAASGALWLVAGDFNGDTKLDLVATNGNAGIISFFPGMGDGTFGAPSNFIAGSQLGGIAAGDLDGDGALDVAVTSGGYVSVLLGNGNGTFQAALLYPAGYSPTGLALADFDQDGHLDAAVVDPLLQTVSILFGTGDGSFGAPAAYLAGSQISGLAVGDLDGDTLPDAVTGNEINAVVELRNAGGGSLQASPSSTLPGPSFYNAPPAVALGDWDGDGRQDLAWVVQNQANVILSVGAGRFAQGQALTGPSQQQLNAIVAGDFNGDGKTDLAASDYSDILLFPGAGNGTFGPAQTVFNSSSIETLAAGDFDGNGKTDIVFSEYSQTLVSLPGNGDGTFGPPVQTVTTIDATGLQPIDLNGDGKQDLIATSGNGVSVLLSNGDGTFQPPVTLTPSGNCCNAYWAAAARFEGTAVDVLVSNSGTSVALYPGNGDGTFAAPVYIALPNGGGALATGDYDGDGHQDFAVSSGNQSVLVFNGLGNGHFQTPVIYPSPAGIIALASGHFAGSGHLDIAAIGINATSTLVNAQLGATVPSAVSVLVGSPVTLTATASGYGPTSYQWRKNGTPLSDGGTISGTTTATLSINPAGFPDAGTYDVLVTDSCTSGASNAATLSVEFADVPVTDIFHTDILTIATAGITAGCGGADYCPSSPVTRAQMSVFLLRSEHGSAYAPPPCMGLFADVPCPSAYADWIEQLANENVTAGCGGGDYCPDASVTRAQMAVFLLKTSQGSAYVPPAATAIFGDVPVDGFAAAWIDDLYTRNIAGGCSASPLLYCPNNSVNRGQMAAFLVNTFFP